jgi:hypothetical protein
MRLFMANKHRGLVISLALLLSACGGNSAMRFYMLEAPLAKSNHEAVLNKNTVIGLGPIHMPEYLDRPQMVLAIGENQYQFDEKNRWAERLDQNLSRVLAQQLAADLGVEQVVRHPWAQRQPIDYQITLDVLTFHQTASGENRLSAQWQIKQQEQTLLTKRFECAITADASQTAAMVKAQSQCVGRLGEEMVSGVKALKGNR